MSDTNNHLKDLMKEWNEVPNWTVLESWKGKGKENNKFYFKIYEDRSGEFAYDKFPWYDPQKGVDNRVFVYCATRRKDRKGYIFDLEEVSN